MTTDRPKDVHESTLRIEAILQELDELEPRLAAAGTGEVELSLLERATELAEQAGRLLERVDQTGPGS